LYLGGGCGGGGGGGGRGGGGGGGGGREVLIANQLFRFPVWCLNITSIACHAQKSTRILGIPQEEHHYRTFTTLIFRAILVFDNIIVAILTM